ncbi:methyltransferase domain-containing protein [Ferrimicrobium sp.]|uniref:class I SAM-dependent methyltransferase n=1 Tax=Ferrimicrobium sp. TaxID=2926050 RepID=UPI00261A0AD4|nr:methyltransferase domain-containing protein [Ferrimicrobium sp.]
MSSDQPKVQTDESASGGLSTAGWGEVIIKHIPRGATVLMLGSGIDELVRALVTELGCTVDAMQPSTGRSNTGQHDAAQSDVAMSNEAKPHTTETHAALQLCREVFVTDLEESDINEVLADRHYDIIVCAEILERLQDPEHLLSQLKAHLDAEGQLLLVVPNVAHIGVISELLGGDFHYRGHGILDPAHLRFFTRQSLLRTLDESGFVAEILDTITLSVADSEFAQSQALADTLLTRVPITIDHDVYELIASAKPRKKGQRRSQEQLHPTLITRPVGDITRVFWRLIDEEYAEDRSVQGTPVDQPGLLSVHLEIPRSPSERFLSLQLLDRVGVIELSDLTLTQNDRELWRWDPESIDELFVEEHRRGLVALHQTVEPTESTAYYFILDPDNRAELNLRLPGSPHETLLELSYRPLIITESTEVIGGYLATVDQHATAQVAKVRGLLNADRSTREFILKGRIKFIEDEKLHLREELVLREKQLGEEKEALQRRIDELLGSTSWRLTAPVRMGKEQLLPKVKGLLSGRNPSPTATEPAKHQP